MSSLPSKLFFRIGEVARIVGVEPHVLRYWEREFRSIRPTKSAKGQRVYSRKDVENLLRVRDLLYRDGFTIAGAKKRLQTALPVAAEADASADAERALEESELDDALPELESVDAFEPATASAEDGASRTKLSALRAEVEAFLEELEPAAPDPGERA